MEAGPSRYWEDAERDARPSIEAVRSSLAKFPSGRLRVSRVAQLDASLLDAELEQLLAAPVLKALEGIRRGHGRDWTHELMAALRVAVLRLSMFGNSNKTAATYGSTLQNLKYRDERKHANGLQSTAIDSTPTRTQKWAYVALQVAPIYVIARLRDTMAASSWADEPLPRSWLSLINPGRLGNKRRRTELKAEWKRSVWELVNASDRLYAMLDLANFLVFLYDGKYRSLIDRLLKLRLIYASRSISRNVSFEFLNRQLVWEAFTEFLLFLMPLVNLHRLRVRLTRLVTNKAADSKTLQSVVKVLPAPVARALGLPRLTAASGGQSKKQNGPLHFLSPDTCPICYSSYASPPTALPATAIPSDPTSSTTALASLTRATTTSTAPVIDSGNDDTSVKIPYVANCGNGCRYCYYCITGKLVQADEAAEDSWDCLRCGQDVTGADRETPSLASDNNDMDPTLAKVEADTESAPEGVATDVVGEEHDKWR